MVVMCKNGSMSLTEYSPNTHLTTQGESLSSLVASWLVSFSSARTRDSYHRDLSDFASWLKSNNAGELLSVTRAHVDLYARFMEEATRFLFQGSGPAVTTHAYAPATRARKLAALSSFYAFLCERGDISVNPVANVRRPKLPNYSPRLGLNLETAPKVLAAVEESGVVGKALFALCFYTGLRVSEALSVRGADIREEAGHTVLEVTSKGGRRDLVPLSPVALRLLEPLREIHGEGPLLSEFDRFAAGRIVAAMGKRAGLSYRLTPHDLRHGAATCSLEAGEPIHRVQQLLRHASPVTTQRYDHSRNRLDASAAYGLARAVSGAA
jgi:integrase/recombinase XerD